jgi:phosphoglycerate dehydrogenase-like enzyme
MFPNLRYIQTISAGLDRVDVDYVSAHGIELHNARGVYSVPMAEFAVGGVLQLYKQAKTFFENQKSPWEKHRDLRELCGKTVTVLGCGSVGTECAKRFRAFGCRVLGVDLFPRQDESYDEILPLTDLNGVLPGTDILLLTVPLTKDTRGLIGADRLARLKPSGILVNIARGPVVDEAALADALRTGVLSGAVLDVFETEPLSETSPLWDMDTVILTPHNSFAGEGNSERLANLIIRNLEVD